MNPEVLNTARKQIGIYLADIMKQRGINKLKLSERAQIKRNQLDYVLNGSREYNIGTFLKIITALDCYFYLAEKEGNHLNPDHMFKQMDPNKSMDFKPE